MLTEYAALELGYNFTDDNSMNKHSFEKYVKEAAEIYLSDYNLTTEQKVNSLRIKHILQVFKKACLYEEHVGRAIELDEMAVGSNGKFSRSLQGSYVYEQHLVDILVLQEGHLAADLLIQTFAPDNIYAKRHVFGNDTANEMNERETQRVRRATGTLNLVNKFFDPEYRLNIDADEVAKLDNDELFIRIKHQVAQNFEKLPYDVVEGTTGQNSLPTKTVSVTPPNIADILGI